MALPCAPLAFLLFSSSQIAGDGAPPQASAVQELEESVITATLSARRSLDTPYSEDVVSEEQLERRAYRTVPQALRDTPGIFVQETAVGQGSPFIRGFTAFRNLFLVDGIRLNNSVFREGPNQYWNTVDPYTIESLEIVKGPSSVLYGSDAIGGTVNARTRNPYAFEGGRTFGGQLFYRGSTAESSNWARAEASFVAGNTGVLMGIGGKDFGSLYAGGSTGRQPNTGYTQVDGDLKVETFLDPDTRMVFGFQHVAQNDVPRTHRTIYGKSFQGTTVGSELRRDLDQRRTLAYGQLHGDNVDSWYDRYSVSLSWHEQEETRHRTRTSGKDEQGFEVGQLGLLGNLSSDTSIGRLTYGFDYYHDDVSSFSSSNPIQGPVGDDSTYDLLGVYVQDEIEASDRLGFVLGARFNYAALDSNSVQDPVSGDAIALDDDWSAFVGSARVLYRLDEDRVHLFGGISQGFRAPNLSDVTRLDSARSNEFEIASPGLDPEYYTQYEVGVKTRSDVASSQVALFYTDISDQIVRFPTGNTNGSGEFEIVKDNVGDGYVYGVEAGGARTLARDWTLFGNAAYQKGEVDTYPTSAQVLEREYLSRLMPFTAQLGVTWERPGSDFWAEVQLIYAADADRLSSRDEGDTDRIPPGGTREYLIANLRGGWRVTDGVTLDLALENLADVNYRVHGSGQNMPGFNVIVGLRMSL